MNAAKQIYITETDKERLEKILASVERTSNIEMLEDEILRATIVPSSEIPQDVVSMRSRVRFVDLDSGDENEVILSYPQEADFASGKLSVLAPVGSALLGLSVGDEILWPLPSGKTGRYKIASVLFQPEAEGQYHL